MPYETETIDMMKGEHKLPSYMKVHPLGRVPALEDNGFVMFESAAIVMQLADKYPEKGLAPAVGTTERAEYYQWILCAMTEAEPPLVTILMHTRFLPQAERSPERPPLPEERASSEPLPARGALRRRGLSLAPLVPPCAG